MDDLGYLQAECHQQRSSFEHHARYCLRWRDFLLGTNTSISKVKGGGVRGMNKKIKGKEVIIGEKSCVF